MKIDLHIHSSLSDGTDSPKSIVDKAKSLGIDCISITDHDCIGAIKLAKSYAQDNKIKYVNGVELSTFSVSEIHILGYCFDENNSALLEKLDYFESKRKERANMILDRLYDLGVKLDRDALPTESASVGRLHIAKLMVAQGYATSVPDAFDRYLGINGKAYCPSKRITPMQGVQLIKQAKGFPVIAHPLRFLQQNTLRTLVDGLKPFGLEGIEAYYPTHDKSVTDELNSLARRYKLLATGGTDYHGENRNIELGSVDVRLDGYALSRLNINK
ncbi:MAG: PHP domain-containing protein [Clostridia bacterium]|nr:PHP domain-containing protein [Clostridia bacterium]MDE7215365.1 PHP domain-containing protein [Clostridia bacterium]